MAVVKKVDGGCLLSHQNFLVDLYHGKFMEILFHLKTPYMMDEQAKALSRNGNAEYDIAVTNRKKRKRKTSNDNPQPHLVTTMKSILSQLEFKEPKVGTC